MYSQNFSSLNELNVPLAERAKKTKKHTNEKKIIVIIKQNLARRKGIQILECGKFLLVKSDCKSGIEQIFAVRSGILGSEESRIPLTISIRNPVRGILSLAFPYVGRKTYDMHSAEKKATYKSGFSLSTATKPPNSQTAIGRSSDSAYELFTSEPVNTIT